MRTSPKITSVSAAILAVQKELKHRIGKSSTANTGKYSYSYVPIEDIQDALKPLCAKHGLVVIQGNEAPITYFESATSSNPNFSDITIVTRVIHAESGEYFESSLTIPYPLINTADPRKAILPSQEVGKANTYGRRYALASFFGFTPVGEDTDGLDVHNPEISIFKNTKPKSKAKTYKGAVAKAVPPVEKPVIEDTAGTTPPVSTAKRNTLAGKLGKKSGGKTAGGAATAKKSPKNTSAAATKSAFPKPGADVADEVFNA